MALKFKKIPVSKVRKGDIISWTTNRRVNFLEVKQVSKVKIGASKEGDWIPFALTKGQKTAVVHNRTILGNLSFVAYNKIRYAWREIK